MQALWNVLYADGRNQDNVDNNQDSEDDTMSNDNSDGQDEQESIAEKKSKVQTIPARFIGRR